jgi:oxygen-independent coproporphyrinogen-3 oxidase
MQRFEDLARQTESALRLVGKYSGAVPRYTSYPTAVEFSQGVKSSDWLGLLKKDPVLQSINESKTQSEQGLSLYVHIPFCRSLCYFCACNKVITKDAAVGDRYLERLEKELLKYTSLVSPKTPIEQLHWGGGTPNFLTPGQVRAFGGTLRETFSNRLPDAEISVETDPRTLTLDHLQIFSSMGFNRLSLGVQDFSPDVQAAINRVQPYELTSEVCAQARRVGLSKINIDLIYGLPLQTVQGFRRTIEQVLKIAPDRVALYGYAHVTWLKKIQRNLEGLGLPSPKDRLLLFLEGIRAFTEAGYRYIGLDHFALPSDSLSQAQDSGRLNRNFMGYTTHLGSRMLALGVSSISIIPAAIVQNYKILGEYEKAIDEKGLAVERGMLRTQDDLVRADVIEKLLCYSFLDIQEFETRWGLEFARYFSAALEKLSAMEADGLILVSPNRLELTSLGRLFARNIASCFDAYLEKHQNAARPVFSQAV